MGNYNDFTYELSEHDYKVIAAGSTGVFENNPTNFDWKYTINHIHTLSWGLEHIPILMIRAIYFVPMELIMQGILIEIFD